MRERQAKPSMERLLMEIVQELGHLHRMGHRLEEKVDYLTEVAGSGGDTAAIEAATAKLKASGDALEQTVKAVDIETK